MLGNEDSVSILGLTGTNGYITAGGLNLIEGRAVYHAVLDYRECSRAPRLNGDYIAVVELTHVELASGGAGSGLTVRRTVDVERTHTADTFAAVVVEYERLLAVVNQLLVEDVEHLEEGSIVGDVFHLALFEMTGNLRTILLRILNGD
mgnify:CR=1 FL=1